MRQPNVSVGDLTDRRPSSTQTRHPVAVPPFVRVRAGGRVVGRPVTGGTNRALLDAYPTEPSETRCSRSYLTVRPGAHANKDSVCRQPVTARSAADHTFGPGWFPRAAR
ncbi:hypothetical protein Asera_63600 [Actinocatenispora sera]|uniref:Uncharacterized protein n=1 Tax=Actinocatenispora sera TaxID=390989 RepID=A0A810LCG3_9ACTN|nr:hypothetical protein Asera_63600 [Actinocatenispora sera]